MKPLSELKAALLNNPQTRAEYEAQAGEFALARELIAARTRVGLTQADVAALMGTSQKPARSLAEHYHDAGKEVAMPAAR